MKSTYILYLCLFTYIFSEVLLSPFYPQFFEKTFAIDGTKFTGIFIFTCRLAVLLSTPVWGKFSQKINTTTLLLFALGCSPFLTGALAFAKTPYIFLCLTVLLLAAKSGMLLIYPLLAETNGASDMSKKFQLLFHGAIITASLCGGLIMSLEEPIRIFIVLAIMDLLLFVLVWRVRKQIPVSTQAAKTSDNKSADQKRSLSMPLVIFLLFGMAVFTFHFGNNIVRPYFTLYAEQTFLADSFTSSILFMLPNAAALMVMPWLHKWVTNENALTFSVIAVFILGLSLLLQWGASFFWLFVGARLFYGLFLASGQAAIDSSFFHLQKKGNTPYAYSLLLLFQNTAMLSAPIGAAYTAETYGLAMPFLAAALMLIASFVFLYHLTWTAVPKWQTDIGKEEKNSHSVHTP
ncbi:MFS transporter [Alteribacillus sp. JSM 102045]|uniref:MFS transporter n=1 Tax=Alteribacillus sp. JSM 102045 TaxID=1562101 RepID=UPI0035BF3BB3